jgi:hypothetical protein
MATVYCIGVVSEANYATFAALCVPSLAGDDYGAFLKNVSEYARRSQRKGRCHPRCGYRPCGLSTGSPADGAHPPRWRVTRPSPSNAR